MDSTRLPSLSLVALLLVMRIVVGLDVLEESVMWALELPSDTTKSGRSICGREDVEAKDKTVQIDASTIAVVESSGGGSARAIMVDIVTGEIKSDGDMILPGYSVAGIFCMETKLCCDYGNSHDRRY